MTKGLNDRAQALTDCIEQILSSVRPAERKRAAELVSELQSVGLTSELKAKLLKILPPQKVEELRKSVQATNDLLA